MFNLVQIYLILYILHLYATKIKGRSPSLDICRNLVGKLSANRKLTLALPNFSRSIYDSAIFILELWAVWDYSPSSCPTFAGSKAPIAEKNFHLLLPSDKYFAVCEGQDKLNGETRRKLADRNDSMVWGLRFWNKSLLFFGIYDETTKGKGLIMLGRP